MRIGYPCVNTGIGCTSARTFRLASYSEQRLLETVSGNIACLRQILEFNLRHGLLAFRLSSDLVPFASHPVCNVPWDAVFRQDFADLGRVLRANGMRASLHPDQFNVLNSPDSGVVDRTLAELGYNAHLLDLMGLDRAHKLQIHVGGTYGDREAAMLRFIRACDRLSPQLRARLAIENDERGFSVDDCLRISAATGLPVVFDTLHWRLNNRGESMRSALQAASRTWSAEDGPPMVDYSSQDPEKRPGAHCRTLDADDFEAFLAECEGLDCDVMLEVKDKEVSALEALDAVRRRKRLTASSDRATGPASRQLGREP